MKKTERIYIRAKSEQVERLQKVKDVLDIPTAQIVRAAIDEKIERLAEEYPALREKLATV